MFFQYEEPHSRNYSSESVSDSTIDGIWAYGANLVEPEDEMLISELFTQDNPVCEPQTLALQPSLVNITEDATAIEGTRNTMTGPFSRSDATMDNIWFTVSESSGAGRLVKSTNEMCKPVRSQPASGLCSKVDATVPEVQTERINSELYSDDDPNKLNDSNALMGSVYRNGKFKCNHLVCTGKTYGRMTELRRHFDTTHAAVRSEHWCVVKSCLRSKAAGQRSFPRRDKRDEHFRKKHRIVSN